MNTEQKSPTLKQEGITKELLNSIDMAKNYSPVQLRPSEDPTKLLKCSTGYWVVLEDGTYLRDDNRKMIVIPEKEAREGRARYLLNFKGEVIEAKIQAEFSRLQRLVDEKLKEVLPVYRQMLVYADRLEKGFGDELVVALAQDSGLSIHFKAEHERKVARAKELVDDDMVESYYNLLQFQQENDYDMLYRILFQNGLPHLATMNITPTGQIGETEIAAFFSAGNLPKAIEEIQGKSHLYNVARFNVMSRKS